MKNSFTRFARKTVQDIPIVENPPPIERLPTLDFTDELTEEMLLLVGVLDDRIMPVVRESLRRHYYGLWQGSSSHPIPQTLAERLTLSYQNYLANFMFSLARDAINDSEDAFADAAIEAGIENVVAPEGV